MKFTPRPLSKSRYIVAIDPDLNASGMAAWCNESKAWLIAQSVSIENILDVMFDFPKEYTTIFVEAGWLIKKANIRGGNYRTAQAKARNVGENHATGKLIIKILRAAGFEVQEFKPLKKGVFKTKAGPWSQVGRDYVKKQSGLSHRMNDDVRDAIYTVLHFR